jgi:hypothetical protein
MEGLREPLELFEFGSRFHSLSPYGKPWVLRKLRPQDWDQRVAARRRWRRIASVPAGSTMRIIGANQSESGSDNRTRVAALAFLGLPTALVLVGWIVSLPLVQVQETFSGIDRCA